jgi:hypothetical protein
MTNIKCPMTKEIPMSKFQGGGWGLSALAVASESMKRNNCFE